MAPEVIRGYVNPTKKARNRCCVPWWASSTAPAPASTSRPAAAPCGASGGGGSAYGPACDCWSCGVILYLLLSGGEPPFSDPSQPRLLRTIVAGKFSFDGPVWKKVSKEAKDLICRLLVVDPDKRWDCRRALGHPWMRGAGGSSRAAGSRVGDGGGKAPMPGTGSPAAG